MAVRLEKIKAQLKRVGYEIEPQERNARTFGVLQNRRRMIIVGWKKGQNILILSFRIEHQMPLLKIC